MGVTVAIQLLLGLLDRAGAIGTLINKAQAEKRDISPAEMNALIEADDAARVKLSAAIAKARSGN